MGQARALLVVLLLGSVLTLLACQSMSAFYQGRQPQAEHVVALTSSAEERVWSTFDLSIHYRVERVDGSGRVFGHVEMSDHYKINYEKLWSLDVYLLLLDEESRVVETRRVSWGVRDDIEDELDFDEQLTLPPNVVAFSFAYEGVAREMSSEAGGSSSFWLRPR